MEIEIPYSKWEPITPQKAARLFAHAPFAWGLAGGYAIELFLGKTIREHGDIDVAVFRDEQLQLQQWLASWQLYAADPPGTLRPWREDEYLRFGIHDIWGHRPGAQAWQLQIMLNESEGSEWFSKRSPLIRGPRADLLAAYQGIPCVRAEVQLMYKAKSHRPKDELDFQACLPLLSMEARGWLRNNLILLYSEGHPWLAALADE
jgi:hypothetical protein